jgi:arginyl-tRNA synthetase
MLCAYYDKMTRSEQQPEANMLADLEKLYREAKKLYDSDPEFAKTARTAVAGLHNGD